MGHRDLLLVLFCLALAACSDSLPPVAGDSEVKADSRTVDAPNITPIRDTGTADVPLVGDTGIADVPLVGDTGPTDGPLVSDTSSADGPADTGPADAAVDTTVDTVAPPTTCVFDNANSLFGSCLFGP